MQFISLISQQSCIEVSHLLGITKSFMLISTSTSEEDDFLLLASDSSLGLSLAELAVQRLVQ